MSGQFIKLIMTGIMGMSFFLSSNAQEMDALWGESTVKLRAEDAQRGQLFEEGNYAMFVHWGLYSQLAGKVGDKTYYGISEWIMNPRRANIPVDEYKKLAKTFNPTGYDADAIARLAVAAGMKYIVVTSKHHDGFAMYDSDASDFNIVDATPFGRDPMKELADACRKHGLGFGFYYSHSQDWTFPGARNGPKMDADGNPATFDDYFYKKCLPQVEEITTRYGPIEIVWFDTPGGMKKEYVQQLVEVVRRNQPNALVSGRAGHDLGDYQTLGDMEVPTHNVEGMWESVDTTNDSWGYAWYDENWKSSSEILHRLIACVARGGTYMLNVGPTGKGVIPQRAQRSLRGAGEWIQRYPQVVYDTNASPWLHALPWGDVTVKGNRLFLSVFEWPDSGRLYLPGLKSEIQSVEILKGEQKREIRHRKIGGWTVLAVPHRAPEDLASVIEITLEDEPQVDPTFAVDPDFGLEILTEFADVEGARIVRDRWMEKFGEWKLVNPVSEWTPEGKAVWEIDVLKAGDYDVSLTYAGEGRLVWGVDVVGGEHIQNQQNSSHVYHEYPVGWINFPSPGRYQVAVSCMEGEIKEAKLKAIRFKPVE